MLVSWIPYGFIIGHWSVQKGFVEVTLSSPLKDFSSSHFLQDLLQHVDLVIAWLLHLKLICFW